MINIEKLRVYPFKTKTIAFSDKPGELNYDIVYFPENTTFQESYSKLNIRRAFVRKVTVADSKIPRLIANAKILMPYRELKLLPVTDIKDKDNNTFIDTSIFMELLDQKFEKESYRRPIVSTKIMNYLQSCKDKSPSNRKKVFMYHIDYDKMFSDKLEFRRIFPVLLDLKKTKEISFDYFMIAITSMGTTVYTLMKNEDNSLPFMRIFALIKIIKSRNEKELSEMKNNPDEAEKSINQLILSVDDKHTQE